MRLIRTATTSLLLAMLSAGHLGLAVAAGAPPSATTGTASNVTATSATITGSANPKGSATSITFQYGTSTAYGTSTSAQPIGSGRQSVSVSAHLSGLALRTTYHFRIVATNSNGTTRGADATFRTGATPTVTTGAASGVSTSGASVAGTVNPNGSSSVASVQYGTSTSYGSSTGTKSLGAGTTATTFSVALTGLKPVTTYHYRVVATNANGTSVGGDKTFVTAKASSSPTPTPSPHVSSSPTTKASAKATTSPTATRSTSASASSTPSSSASASSTPSSASSASPVASPSPAPTLATTTTATHHSSSAWPWIALVLGVVLLVAIGALARRSSARRT